MDFLDKLEQVLIHSQYRAYTIPNTTNQGKPTIHISPHVYHDKLLRNTFIKEFIHYLKNPEIDSKYRFAIEFFEVNEYDEWIMDSILTLNPLDEDFSYLYNRLRFYENEVPGFLALLKNKSSFIELLNKGNSSSFSVNNDKEFLEKCLSQGKKFQFSPQEYYDIFFSYLKNSKQINNKDNLFKFFSQHISNQSWLENLFALLYKQEKTNENVVSIETIQKITLSSFALMKNYKFIDSEELNLLLSCFAENMNKNIDKLSDTKSIEILKSEDNNTDSINYSLLVDTTNTTETLYLLDLYLHYFVQFNNNAKLFTDYLKDNPHIFQKFILNKKLNDKLAIKNIQHTTQKI